MKKSIVLLMLVGFLLTACSPSISEKKEIVDHYFDTHNVYECKITSKLKDPLNDSTIIIRNQYYIVAKDVWDAQRIFNSKLQAVLETAIDPQVTWTEVPIAVIQLY